jgi:peptidoglycan hydrolase-like protein with peptidoglycan-binding domain
VSTENILDAISVNVTVRTISVPPLTTTASGTVTQNFCRPGVPINSGKTIAAVDGQPLIALATPQPFWRDLSIGESGSDVSQLQTELRRLGYRVGVTGTFNWITLHAIQQLAEKNGDSSASIWTDFPLSQFVWIPSSSIVPLTCGLEVSATVAPGGTVATLPSAVASAELESVPSNAVPGDRVLLLGSTTLPVSSDGQIVGNANLAKLTHSAAYSDYVAGQAASAGTSSGGSSDSGSDSSVQGQDDGVPATYRLASSIRVTIVTPAALYDQNGKQACVQSLGAAIPVTVVGSQLGETYVTLPASRSIRRITLDPANDAPCR